MLSDSPAVGDSDVFPPVLSVNDHAELSDWFDRVEADRASRIDQQAEEAWVREMVLRESESAAA